MSRGLGRIQKLTLKILKEEKPNKNGWYDVASLTYQIVYGIDCFRSVETSFKMLEPTESEKQSVYRAVRRLEKLGHIETRIKTHPPRIYKDTKSKELKIKV